MTWGVRPQGKHRGSPRASIAAAAGPFPRLPVRPSRKRCYPPRPGPLGGVINRLAQAGAELQHRVRDIGGTGVADLVEVYWSVRTLNGKQDPNWAPSLNIKVVELKNVPLQVEDLVQLYRYSLILKHGLRIPDLTSLVDSKRISLYVRGLLLGREISSDVAAASALLNHAEVPITVGKFSLCPVKGLTISSSPRDEEMWVIGVGIPDLLKVGHQLTDQAVLLRSNGRWPVDPGA